MVAFGIDLGTAYIRAAWLDGGKPVLARDASGGDAIPAVVGFEAGSIRTGQAALARAAASPGTTVRGIKRWLGRSHDDVDLAAFPEIVARAVPGPPGQWALVRLGAEEQRAEAIAAHLLDSMTELVAEQACARPDSVTLTAPRWLSQQGRMALREAAVLAGLVVDEILDDAAAIALTLPAARQSTDQLVAIVDAGAGGVSASIVQVRSTQVMVIAAESDGTTGGDDLDRALGDLILLRLGSSLSGHQRDPGIVEMSRQLAETMKRELSLVPQVSEAAPFVGGGPQVVLERADLEPLLQGLLQRIESVCSSALRVAGLSPYNLASIHISGGMAQVPSVRARVGRVFGKDPSIVQPSGGCPALGAAIFAAMRRGLLPAAAIVTQGAPPRSGREGAPVQSAPLPASGPRVVVASPNSIPPASDTRYSWVPVPISHMRPSMPSSEPSGTSAPVRPFHLSIPPISEPVISEAPAASPSDEITLPFIQQAARKPADTRELRAGRQRFVRPASAEAILHLAIAQPEAPVDLAAITLPVLFLRRLARQRVSGVLTLDRPGNSVALHVLEGRACLLPNDLGALAQAFLWPEGTYVFLPGEFPIGARLRESMVRVTVEGLRALSRCYPPDDLEAALGERLDLAPVLRPDSLRIVGRFGLHGQEAHLVGSLHGKVTARRLLQTGSGQGGVGRAATLELLFLLTIFDGVDWAAARISEQTSLRDLAEEHARKMISGSYFDALGVHWTASGPTIAAAYRTLGEKLAPGGPWDRAAPEACLRMRERVETAFFVLSVPALRMAHRISEHPADEGSVPAPGERVRTKRSTPNK